MTTNVSQNYPYGSETEAQRSAAVEAAYERFEGLRERVAADTTPLEPREIEDHGAPTRWWVWVCPKDDFRGRLHVAGYPRDKHGVYAVCDTHGDTYLR